MSATVDTRAFEEVAYRYAEAGNKTLEFALWRGLWQWSKKALAHYRGVSPRQATLARIDQMFFTGRRGGSRQWRLVEWLAKGRPLAGGHPLTEFARAEKRARRKSVGFTSALLVAIGRAARVKAEYIAPTGLRGTARKIAGGLGSAVAVEAVSVYEYRTPLSRAKRPRVSERVERAALDAFAATQDAQVADMETYIARKLQEAAPK